MNQLLKRYPGSTIAMGTFTTTDTDLPDVRGRVAAVKAAVKLMFNRRPGAKTATMAHRGTIAAQCALEVTPVLDDTGQIRWQVHQHSLILLRAGCKGRDYLHKDGRYFKKAWAAAIGPTLYLSAEVTPSPAPLQALRYCIKASHNMLWKQYRDPRYRDRSLPVALIVSRAEALKGLTLNLSFGLFAKVTELAELIGGSDE